VNKLPPPRRAHLANYLRELVQDVAAQGKVAKIVGNPVEVAAVAIMSGSIAVAQTMWEDVSALAGHAKANARTVAGPVLGQLASRGAEALFSKFFGK
jgi:3-methyladenine DNA glycosylase/8-oxoguanine DNA glycosylase